MDLTVSRWLLADDGLLYPLGRGDNIVPAPDASGLSADQFSEIPGIRVVYVQPGHRL